MNNYSRYFATQELTAMTLSDMEMWFRSSNAEQYINDMDNDYAGLLSACMAELFDTGGVTIYGAHATIEWLKDEEKYIGHNEHKPVSCCEKVAE